MLAGSYPMGTPWYVLRTRVSTSRTANPGSVLATVHRTTAVTNASIDSSVSPPLAR